MPETIERELNAALDHLISYIGETTGKEADQGEIARALRRYFVLSEIKGHIEMERDG